MSEPAEVLNAPPLADPEVELAGQLMSASGGFGIRFLARFVDLLFAMILAAITGIGSGIVFGVLGALGRLREGWTDRLQQTSFSVYAFAILGGWLYHSFCDGIAGTTIGKLVCGLRVVQTDGRPCTVAGAFKRDLAYHWDALFIGLIAYSSMKDSPMQQRYGDKWGQTVVVKRKLFTVAEGRPGGTIAAGIIVGSLFYMLCEFADLLLRVQ